MFKFTVVYLLLLIVLALMGGLTISDQQAYTHPHAALGQVVIIAGVWFVVCFFIAMKRARVAKRPPVKN